MVSEEMKNIQRILNEKHREDVILGSTSYEDSIKMDNKEVVRHCLQLAWDRVLWHVVNIVIKAYFHKKGRVS
jgi:hypothetical protein